MRLLPTLPLSLLITFLLLHAIQSFAPTPTRRALFRPTTELRGLKGGKFSKQKNLAAKMEAARRQRREASGETAGSAEESAEEIKMRNDRMRFESLLENSLVEGEDMSSNYLTLEQEEEAAEAGFRGINRLYEGDPAPTAPFANLLDVATGSPLSKSRLARLLPRVNDPRDYAVIIADPRPKSSELRTAVRKLCSGSVAEEIVERCVVVNSDGAGENRRYLKKNFGEGSLVEKVTVLIDEDLDWMREYTALGDKRFSMTVFVLSDGKCQKIAREVDPDLICNTVSNAVKAMKANRY